MQAFHFLVVFTLFLSFNWLRLMLELRYLSFIYSWYSVLTTTKNLMRSAGRKLCRVHHVIHPSVAVTT